MLTVVATCTSCLQQAMAELSAAEAAFVPAKAAAVAAQAKATEPAAEAAAKATAPPSSDDPDAGGAPMAAEVPVSTGAAADTTAQAVSRKAGAVASGFRVSGMTRKQAAAATSKGKATLKVLADAAAAAADQDQAVATLRVAYTAVKGYAEYNNHAEALQVDLNNRQLLVEQLAAADKPVPAELRKDAPITKLKGHVLLTAVQKGKAAAQSVAVAKPYAPLVSCQSAGPCVTASPNPIE